LKSEGSHEDTGTVIGTADSASVAESTAVDPSSDERESQSSPAPSSKSQSISNDRVKGKGSGYSTPKSDIKPTKDKENLIGKINNLVTTDLGNIVDGQGLLLIGTLQFLVGV